MWTLPSVDIHIIGRHLLPATTYNIYIIGQKWDPFPVKSSVHSLAARRYLQTALRCATGDPFVHFCQASEWYLPCLSTLIALEETLNYEQMIGSILNPTKERRWRLSADSADMKLSSSGCNFSQRAAGGPVAGVRPCGILICTALCLCWTRD